MLVWVLGEGVVVGVWGVDRDGGMRDDGLGRGSR